MKWILVLLLIFIVIFLSLSIYLSFIREEAFTDKLDPEFVKRYQTFLLFYHPFLDSWEKSIITSIATDIPQKPLLKPRDTQSGASITPSRSQINEYIHTLSQQLQISLPDVTDHLPDLLVYNDTLFQQLSEKIPNDPAPYLNALQWMNNGMIASHHKLDSALQGKSSEGFDTNICQAIEECTRAQQEKKEKEEQILKKQIELRIDKFIINKELQNTMKKNIELVKKSKDIQDQAQNGTLLQKMNLPSEPDISYSMPEGSDISLDDMKKRDPAKYKEYQSKYSQFFSIKQLAEQINRNLR